MTFGQFVDHDITFDPNSSLDQINDPDALTDFRTPRFDLDSVYGSGPADEPFQYDLADDRRLLVEPNVNGELDLPRNRQGIAVIGDPRNDENVVVGQLQLVLLRLHNKLLDEVLADTVTAALARDRQFHEAQRLTRWHYQWVVVHDYLRRITDPAVYDQLFFQPDDEDGNLGPWEIHRRFYRPTKNAYMPVEFSAAAFRFGHSMVRGIYNLNDVVRDRPIFAPGDSVGPTDDLRGRRPLPSAWTIDWPQFLVIDGSIPQPSRLIDSKLVPALFDLPGEGPSLAFRNLKRSQALGLPPGQDVAKLLRAPTVLTTAELGTGVPDPTPLWFYILRESELQSAGVHLGYVGSRVVAEVLLGLLELDRHSFLSQQPDWVPTLEGGHSDHPESFTLSDLVRFATT